MFARIPLRAASALAAAFILVPLALAQPVPPDVVWETSISSRSLDFSPDGSQLLSGGSFFLTGRLAVLDAADGSTIGQRDISQSPINDVAFAPDGQAVASAHGTIQCDGQSCFPVGPAYRSWTAPNLQQTSVRTDVRFATSVDYAPDGQELAVGFLFENETGVRLVDPVSLDLEMEVLVPTTRTVVSDVAYSPDGSVFATVDDEGMLRAWDAETGLQRYAVTHGSYLGEGGEPISVAFSPDGALLATGGFGDEALARLWDADTGALLDSYELELDGVMDGGRESARVAFTPNGRYLALGINDDVDPGLPEAAVRFVEIATSEIVYAIAEPFMPNQSGIGDVAFTPALNDRFAYTRSGTVKLVEVPLDLASGSAPLTVSAEPVGPPVVVPPSGGSFDFVVTLVNVTDESQTVEVRSRVEGPVGRDPVLGPVAFTLPPGQTVTRTVTQQVPAPAPAGVYTYTVEVAPPGGESFASDAFTVTKEAGARRPLTADAWRATGLDAATGASASAEAPQAYALVEAGPNPFRTGTAFNLTVADAQIVRADAYDALGRHVATLLDQTVAAGATARLGLDGAALPSGVYLLRVVGETFTTSRRVTRVD
ncbi:MAG: T9SS type A sorting domain-containing protein [Rubricoccaceae bacterium]|nr:T9SS type A sorting domain-containing protein [Rubricoccaceae bacterium]